MNEFMKVIPRPHDDMSVYKHIPDVDTSDITQISLLSEFRYPLPYMKELEREVYWVIARTYEKKKETPLGLMPAHDDASIGVSLIGRAGCGKSSSVRSLMKFLPEKVTHDFGTYKAVQVPMLFITAPANSNFSALMNEVGLEADRVLELDDVYLQKMKKARTLYDKVIAASQVINLLRVGIIVIDECQNIQFKSTREGSFESLLVLSSLTDVPYLMVGNEEAYIGLSKTERNRRRAGTVINASAYCSDTQFLKKVAHELAGDKCNADDLVDASGGLVGNMVRIYQRALVDNNVVNHKVIHPVRTLHPETGRHGQARNPGPYSSDKRDWLAGVLRRMIVHL